MTSREQHPTNRIARTAMLTILLGACSTPTVSQTAGALDQTILGTAQSFSVLGGSTVTSTGATIVHGNLGVAPGLAVTGFPPGLVTDGSIHGGDAVALQAQTDITFAYLALAAEVPTSDLTGQDLGGLTLTPGIYRFASSAQLTGALTLDAQNDPAAVFVFQIGSTLTTASNASVLVMNGATDCNIFWQVGSSATLGTTTAFKGNLLALASITLTTGATVSGRTLARTGAVTMDTNDVSILSCGAGPGMGTDAGPSTDTDGGLDAGIDAGGLVDGAIDGGNDAGVPVDCAVDAPPIDAGAPADCGMDAGVDAGAPADAACDAP